MPLDDADVAKISELIAGALKSSLDPLAARIDGQSRALGALDKLVKSGVKKTPTGDGDGGDPPAGDGQINRDLAARLKKLEEDSAAAARERIALDREYVRSKIRGVAADRFKIPTASANDLAEMLTARHADQLVRDGSDVVFATADARLALDQWLDLFLHGDQGKHWLPQRSAPPRIPALSHGVPSNGKAAPNARLTADDIAAGNYDPNLTAADVARALQDDQT